MSDKNTLNNSIKWWEKKRLYFNIVIGFTGIIAVITFHNYPFTLFDFIGIILWGIVANIFFSSGTMLEIFNYYYLKDKLKIYNFRLLFFLVGTFLYAIVTYYYAYLYYSNFILFD